MPSLEEYIDGLLPLQQETVARAALAGVRWERTEETDYVAGGRGNQGWRKVKRTKYIGLLADGRGFGTFDDIYEVAVVGLSIVNTPDNERVVEDPGAGLFELRPENEPHRTRRSKGGLP